MSIGPQDVVGIFDESFNQLFETAEAMRCLVNEDAKPMEHPMESGAVNTDHIVFLPTEIELSLILDPEDMPDVYQQIKDKWKAAETVSVQTKTDTYTSMLITKIPHDEETDMVDTVGMGVRLRQIIIVTAQYSKLPAKSVKKASNASTTKTGQKQPTPASAPKTSAAYDLIFGAH